MFSPLVFLGGFVAALIGLLLWGVGYSVQDTLLKAVVAGMMPSGWLIGSLATGLLYKHSIPGVIGFSVAVQLSAIPLFLFANRGSQKL